MFVIIKRTLFDLFFNPVIILIYIVEFALLLLLFFGFGIEMNNDKIVGIIFLNKMFEEVGVFLNIMVPEFVSFILLVFLFLSLIVSSSIITESFKNQLNKIILTKNISRAKLIISKYLGINTYFILNFMIFSLLISLIIFIKTQFIVLEPLILSLSLISDLLWLSSLFFIFGLLIESETANSVIGIAIAFIISPYIHNNSESNVLAAIASYILPHINSIQSRELLSNAVIFNLILIPSTLLYIFAYMAISILLYNKRDIE